MARHDVDHASASTKAPRCLTISDPSCSRQLATSIFSPPTERRVGLTMRSHAAGREVDGPGLWTPLQLNGGFLELQPSEEPGKSQARTSTREGQKVLAEYVHAPRTKKPYASSCFSACKAPKRPRRQAGQDSLFRVVPLSTTVGATLLGSLSAPSLLDAFCQQAQSKQYPPSSGAWTLREQGPAQIFLQTLRNFFRSRNTVPRRCLTGTPELSTNITPQDHSGLPRTASR